MGDLGKTWYGNTFYNQNQVIQNCFDMDSNSNWTPEICLGECTSDISLDVFVAASIGDYSGVKSLITNQMTLTKAMNQSHWNALMYAVYYNREDIVMLLLENGAPLHACNENGQNVLMIAAKEGLDSLMEHFLNCGSHSESRCDRDWTPLIYAVCHNNSEAAQVMLKNRANPNALVRTSGETALMFAAANGSLEMVELLLSAGAFPNFKCISGKDSLDYALENGHDDVAALLNRYKSKDERNLFEGPNAIDSRLVLPYQQKRNYSDEGLGCAIYTSDLDSLLLQFNLESYIPFFRKHEVDLPIFLGLSDKDLKECGVTQLGPRRKMLDAISSWHSNAPSSRNTLDNIYELKLRSQNRELQEQLSENKKCLIELESYSVGLEKRLMECHSRCLMLKDHLAKVFQSIFPNRAERFVNIFHFIDDFLQFINLGGRLTSRITPS